MGIFVLIDEQFAKFQGDRVILGVESSDRS